MPSATSLPPQLQLTLFHSAAVYTPPHPLPLLPRSVYMDQVERDLMSTLDRLMREETWQPLSADLPVLKSSNELVRKGWGPVGWSRLASGREESTASWQGVVMARRS